MNSSKNCTLHKDALALLLNTSSKQTMQNNVLS
jgi:hypothetical protein